MANKTDAVNRVQVEDDSASITSEPFPDDINEIKQVTKDNDYDDGDYNEYALVKFSASTGVDDSVVTYTLPESLFSYLPIFQALWNRDENCCFPSETGRECCIYSAIHQSITGWPLLMLTVLCQIFFIVYINDAVRNASFVDSCPTNASLRWFSILIFTSYIFTDIKESVVMAAYFRAISTIKRYGGADGTETIDKSLLRKVGDVTSGNTEGPAEAFTETYGWTTEQKSLALVGSVFPKLVIACTLWFCGCGFLQVSPDNGTLIFNTVGVLFVLDIDDILYKALIPERQKADHGTVTSHENSY